MNLRRLIFTFSATAGGLLAAAFLPNAVASAQPLPFLPAPAPLPVGPPAPFEPPPFALPPPFGPGAPPVVPPTFPIPPGETLPPPGAADIFGFAPVGPEDVFKDVGTAPFFTDVEGFQNFETVTPQTGFPLGGVFLGDEDILRTPFFSNSEIVVDRDYVGSVAPPVGSVFDVSNFGNGYENIYEQIGSGPGAPLEDVLVTPYGDYPLTAGPPEFLDPGFDPSTLPEPISLF